MATRVTLVCVCIALLLSVSIADAIGNMRSSHFRALQKRARDQMLRQHPIRHSNKMQQLTLLQRVDHFGVTPAETFPQRYWYNDEFFTDHTTGPVFLYIEGEGEASSWGVTGGLHYQLAKENKALLVSLEHRFYGLSQPTGSWETADLSLLSSEQALADLALFVTNITATFKLTSANKWIVFGGSYAGAMSAWFRLKYPHLVLGAVASSAPVQAVLDFTGYNDVVASALGDKTIGGHPDCLQDFVDAFAAFDEKLSSTEGRTELSKAFQSCAVATSDEDVMMFANNLGGLVQGMVQYNSQQDFNITFACQTMMSADDPITGLMSVSSKLLGLSGADCMDNSYKNYVDLLSAVTPTADGNMRQWTYQTCTEFGYYQTCEKSSKCPLSHYMTLDSNLKICKDVFKIQQDADEYLVVVADTNAEFGGAGIVTSNVFFPNGDVDPWHSLSVLTGTPSANVISDMIHGTSHCYDMYELDETSDPQELIVVKKAISDFVAALLRGSRASHATKGGRKMK